MTPDSRAEGTAYDPGDTLRRWWLAEGQGPANRRWLGLCHETGREWVEARIYGPPSAKAMLCRWFRNGVLLEYGKQPKGADVIKGRAALLLPRMFEWIATGKEPLLAQLKKEWEDG